MIDVCEQKNSAFQLDFDNLDAVSGGAFFIPFDIGFGKRFLTGGAVVAGGASIIDFFNLMQEKLL